MDSKKNIELLGDKGGYLLSHTCTTIDKKTIHLPSPNHIEEIWVNSNRNNQVLRSLQALLDHGRLGGTNIHLSAFITACAGNRMDLNEISDLTKAMIASGKQLYWNKKFVVSS